jgi:two-component system cell cycle sensor histidine kinase/response regulator CckA
MRSKPGTGLVTWPSGGVWQIVEQVLQPKTIDLNALAAGVMPMLRRLIGEHIEIVMVPGPDLGYVMADPVQVEQVIMNLVVNARDAMPDGGMVKIETANREVPETRRHAQGQVPPGRYVSTAGGSGNRVDQVMMCTMVRP